MKAATLLLAAALLYACGGSRHRVTVEAVADDCVQVLYFHGKQRCATCTAIERLTREVVDSIGSEKGLVLRIIDIAENEALADRYQAGWSALILDQKRPGGKSDPHGIQLCQRPARHIQGPA